MTMTKYFSKLKTKSIIFIFEGNDEIFRDECRRSMIAKYDNEEEQFLNLVLLDIALDTVID